ncbi:MAG TPA: NfeD family protein [Planctomycetota bacterium]|nr:NfeD family protein [Planctomycetota bacterium]
MPILTALAQSAGDAAATSVLEPILTLGGLVSHTEFWLWMTLIVLIIEIFTSGFFIGAFAIATLVAAAGAWFGLGINGQLVVFSLVSIASLVWARPVFLRLLATGRHETNAASLVGQNGTVIDQISSGGIGRVRMSNEEWRATAATPLSVGDAVRVLGVTGNTLTVGKI